MYEYKSGVVLGLTCHLSSCSDWLLSQGVNKYMVTMDFLLQMYHGNSGKDLNLFKSKLLGDKN